MTSEKFISFMLKLLSKTKDGTIKWSRFTPSKASDWSQLKSFSCVAGSMQIRLLSDEESDNIQFQIRYDDGLPSAVLEPESDDEWQIALRLVNYVHDQFPNLEKSIDAFLMDD